MKEAEMRSPLEALRGFIRIITLQRLTEVTEKLEALVVELRDVIAKEADTAAEIAARERRRRQRGTRP